jgi:4-aminobutyrate aminotransferase / (S)-3-amino-2-methylpropionate transaminase / 5-aminovalerate transaminase
MGRFETMAAEHRAVGDVRGRGAMCAIELVADRKTKEPLGADAVNAISRGCLEQGVLVLTAGTYGNVVRLLPPITIDEALLGDGLDVLDTVIGTVTD